MNALWLSLFSLLIDDPLRGKSEEEPDCVQAVGVLADASDGQSR